jgi:hypothetical protein
MKEKAVGKLRRFGAGSSRFPIPRFSAAVAGFVAERDGKPEARWGRPKGRAERRLSPGVIAAPLSGSSRSHCSGANLQEFFPAQRGIESVIPHPLAESLFIFYNGQRKKSAVTAEVLSVSFRWSWCPCGIFAGIRKAGRWTVLCLRPAWQRDHGWRRSHVASIALQ